MVIRWRAWLAAGALVALAGCGRPTGGPSGADGGQGLLQAFQASFDRSFNQAFAKSTHDSCVASAQSSGAAPDRAERYCTCVVAQLAPLSVDEKRKLTPTSDKLAEVAAICRAQAE